MPLTASVTGNVTLQNNGWTRIAQGEGLVTLSTQDYSMSFAITAADVDPDPGVEGHPIARGSVVPLELKAGEFLSVKGRAAHTLQVTADVPMV